MIAKLSFDPRCRGRPRPPRVSRLVSSGRSLSADLVGDHKDWTAPRSARGRPPRAICGASRRRAPRGRRRCRAQREDHMVSILRGAHRLAIAVAGIDRAARTCPVVDHGFETSDMDHARPEAPRRCGSTFLAVRRRRRRDQCSCSRPPATTISAAGGGVLAQAVAVKRGFPRPPAPSRTPAILAASDGGGAGLSSPASTRTVRLAQSRGPPPTALRVSRPGSARRR